MRCSSCSSQIPADAHFCPYCGSQVVIATTGATERLYTPSTSAREGIYAAKTIYLGDFLGDITITEVAGRDAVRILVDGDPDQVQQFHIDELTSSAIELYGMIPYLSPYSEEAKNLTYRVILNGNLLDIDNRLAVTIEVPSGITISTQGTLGALKVNCPTCKLKATTTNLLDLTVENIGDLDLEASAQARAVIGFIGRTAKITSLSQARVKVDDAEVSKLTIRAEQSGKVAYYGVAIEAHVKAISQGEVSVRTVGNILYTYAGEQGSITIEEGQTQSLEAIAQNMGNITHNGIATWSSLTASGMSEIYLERGIYSPEKSAMTGSTITVNRIGY